MPGERAYFVWLKRLAAAGLGLVAGLALLEGAMQLFGSHQPHPPLYPGERIPPDDPSAEPSIGWKLPPSSSVVESKDEYSVTYRANPQGFRSPHDFEDGSGAPRIALLGDSYTFGSGVPYEQTFAALLEAKTPGSATLNYGIGGFGVDQMWMTLRHYALPLRTDIVVLTFIRHDLQRSLSAYRKGHVWLAKPTFKWTGEGLAPLTAEDAPGWLLRLVQTRSRLVEVLRRAGQSRVRHTPNTYLWRLNREIFRAIRDECRAAGVDLAVVYLPVNNLQPMPMLEEEFGRLDIPFLDLTPLLPEDAQRLYYPRDRHLNAVGHEFTAQAIHAFLTERGLIE